jgi:hypothetical protein
MMQKSANKRWKESGTSLSFKEWIDRENKKNEPPKASFLPFESNINEQVSDTIRTQIDEVRGIKRNEKGTKTLGIDNGILIFSGLLIAGSLGFYFYKKLKDKK